jgi:hypothetical protein
MRSIFHLIFWVIITVIFLFDRRFIIQKAGLGHFFECIIVRLSLIMSLAYINLYVLIPRFFSNKKYALYFGVLLLTLGTYVTLQNLYDIHLYGFVIGYHHYNEFWYGFPFNLLTTAWYLLLTTAFKLSLDWYEQRKELMRLQAGNNLYILDDLKRDDDYIFLKSGTSKLKTCLSSITHIQGLKDYSVVYTEETKIIIKGSLKITESLFPARAFIRIHKSYLIAPGKIARFGKQVVVLKNNITIPIGRSYKAFFENNVATTPLNHV